MNSNSMKRISHGPTHPVLIVTMLDPIVHTKEHPYCTDSSCPCYDERVQAFTQIVEQAGYRIQWAKRLNGSQGQSFILSNGARISYWIGLEQEQVACDWMAHSEETHERMGRAPLNNTEGFQFWK